ncbi:DNA-binding storekeeper protein-related transcriptional regulator [Raphanus sativus]|nr:DNA-binding storekeeper protein-related transcriptional regulator [Raphanus sativus]
MKTVITTEGVNQIQTIGKIRQLQRKYTSMACSNGWDWEPSEAHDRTCFALSRQLWGPNGLFTAAKVEEDGVGMSARGPPSSALGDDEDVPGGDLEQQKWFDKSFLVQSIASSSGLDEDTVKLRWSSAPVESKKKIEEMMKALRPKELAYVSEKAKFMQKLIYEK